MEQKHTTANFYSSKYYCRKKTLKTCQERPHLLSSRFIKVFYKTTTCPRWPLLHGPKWSSYTVLTVFDWPFAFQWEWELNLSWKLIIFTVYLNFTFQLMINFCSLKGKYKVKSNQNIFLLTNLSALMQSYCYIL